MYVMNLGDYNRESAFLSFKMLSLYKLISSGNWMRSGPLNTKLHFNTGTEKDSRYVSLKDRVFKKFLLYKSSRALVYYHSVSQKLMIH